MTYGWKRAEILSAQANGLTLLGLAAWLTYEAIRRLINPPEVTGGLVLATALVGIVVNVLAGWMISRANRTSLNVEGAYQHILNDLFAFIATAVAGLIIMLTGFARADGIATLIVVVLVLGASCGTWHWLRRSKEDAQIRRSLDTITSDYRRIIVLMDGAANFDPALRARCRTAGRRIFWDKQVAVGDLSRDFEAEPRRIRQVLAYVASSNLRDACLDERLDQGSRQRCTSAESETPRNSLVRVQRRMRQYC